MRNFILLISFLYAFTASAQDTAVFHIIFSIPEYSMQDFSDFEEFTVQHGLPFEDVRSFYFGGGISVQYKRFRYSLSSGGNYDRYYEKKDTSLTYTRGQFNLDLGYNVFQFNKFKIYPYVAYKVNLFEYDLNIKEYHSSFVNYLQSTSADKSFTFLRDNIVLGAGIEYGNKFIIGLRTGYYIPIGRERWEAGDNTFYNDIPSIKYKYFISLYVGGLPRKI